MFNYDLSALLQTIILTFTLILTAFYIFYRIILFFNHKIAPQKIAHYLLTSVDSSKDGFEKIIGAANNCIQDSIKCQNGLLEMEFTVPDNLVDNKDNSLSLGAILALGDSLTTILSVACDKTHRPGVSVTLSGQLHGNASISAGQTLKLKAQIEKLGLNLGFMTMQVYSSNSNYVAEKIPHANIPKSADVLIATVSHVKYLRMGFLWDNFGDAIPAVYKMMHWIGLLPPKRGFKTYDNDGLSSSNKLPILNEIIQLSTNDNLMQFIGNPYLENPFRFIHGGAIACAVDMASKQLCMPEAADVKKNTRLCVSHIEINYLLPLKGKIEICLQDSTYNYPTKIDLKDDNRNKDASTYLMLDLKSFNNSKSKRLLATARITIDCK